MKQIGLKDNKLQNYIKLSDVIRNTTKYLKTSNIVIDDINFNNRTDAPNFQVATFNTLIASGFNAICYKNDKNLIKTNFDFTGNNRNVLLDYNIDCIKELVKTKQGETQTRLK